MEILKGFKALEYVLKNKKEILYNNKGHQLKYDKDKNRLSIKGSNSSYYSDDNIYINDKNLTVEWYTENKVKVLVKIYKNDKLVETQNQYIFDMDDNIERMIHGLKCGYAATKYGNDNIKIEYEIYG